ncbi:hypothetical protein [Chryseobacterium sp. OV279]|uniref:hypothetical protein n=1 Tax=Chryseobacterium sp. OV279 TaxID=1500285 RepID=UPI0015873ECA|nr:hypothetical protein [Chryseobacterium sp. OV279]
MKNGVFIKDVELHESSLTKNFDKELSEIYFKMLKHRNSIKVLDVESDIDLIETS